MGSPEAMLNLHLEKDIGPQLWAGGQLWAGQDPLGAGAVLGANPEGRRAMNWG